MTENFTTKDSGDRRVFNTGAQRDQSSGKGRYDLLDWAMIDRDAHLVERGAIKYGEKNYQRGMPLKVFIDSAFRHLAQLVQGDRAEDHAAAVRWNVAALEWTLIEIRAGRLPWNLAEGTVFALPVAATPDAQRPGEDAKAHRDRVNSPWASAIAFENGPDRTPIVPTSLGKVVTVKSGDSIPDGSFVPMKEPTGYTKTAYQDLENYPRECRHDLDRALPAYRRQYSRQPDDFASDGL